MDTDFSRRPRAMRATAGWLVALILVFVWGWWRQDVAEARGREEQARADSIAFDGVLTRAEAAWSVQTAEAVESVADSLRASQDTALARLGADLAGARARVRQLEAVRLSLEGRVTALADSAAGPAEAPVSVSGTLEDGFLSGAWRYDYEPRALALDYRAEADVELVTVEGGDGRLAVLARSPDPRLVVTFDRLLIERPEPVVVRRSSWRGLLLSFLSGAAACSLVCR